MTRKIRLIILFACALCFVVIAPILISYSMGYRFDFEKMKITLTGGIYIRSSPAADEIIIDSKIKEKPGIFSNSVFIQSLLPNSYSVLVKKAGYYDYSKNIPVLEKEVTKLEEILLIKKDTQFELVKDQIQSPFNIKTTTPIIKNAIATAEQNNNIIWLKTDGLFYKSEINNLDAEPVKITLTPIKIKPGAIYKIILDNKNIFLNANNHLLIFDSKTNDFENFYSPINDAKISPDGKNIVYYDNNNVYISPTQINPVLKNNLYKSPEKIIDSIWLNNSYIIFIEGLPGQGNKIIISEIDYRGSINYVALPQKADKIYFNQQEGKLYVLTEKTLLVSEKLIP